MVCKCVLCACVCMCVGVCGCGCGCVVHTCTCLVKNSASCVCSFNLKPEAGISHDHATLLCLTISERGDEVPHPELSRRQPYLLCVEQRWTEVLRRRHKRTVPGMCKSPGTVIVEGGTLEYMQESHTFDMCLPT